MKNIDLSFVIGISRGKKEVIVDFVNCTMVEIEMLVSRIENELDHNNIEKVKQLLHQKKALVAMVKLEELLSEIANVEEQVKNGNLDKFKISTLKEIFYVYKESMEEELSKY